MSTLLALDVAIMPPPDVRDAAVRLSTALPADDFQGLRLDESHLPHVTLTQLFVRADELPVAFERIDEVLRTRRALPLRITGSGQGGSSVWMAVETTPALQELHEHLMEALRGVERPGGTPAAFYGGDARLADVLWVAGYRLKSSFGAFTPHITLGHAATPPAVEPMSFTAELVAACHLGRFCTCREVLRTWTLT